MSLMKELARDALDNMWSKVTSPETYIEGGCSFCKLVENDCERCLLPDYCCKKENGKLKKNTLISKIRYARDNDDEIGFVLYLSLIKTMLHDLLIHEYIQKDTNILIKNACNKSS
jgi:hypothetical protein